MICAKALTPKPELNPQEAQGGTLFRDLKGYLGIILGFFREEHCGSLLGIPPYIPQNPKT